MVLSHLSLVGWCTYVGVYYRNELLAYYYAPSEKIRMIYEFMREKLQRCIRMSTVLF